MKTFVLKLIRLFVVQAISLGPCRRPIEFLTSSHPFGYLSKIPNFHFHKVEKWKFRSPFQRRVLFVISHEHKNNFLKWFDQTKSCRHVAYRPRIDPTKVEDFKRIKILKLSNTKICTIFTTDSLVFYVWGLLIFWEKMNQFWANLPHVGNFLFNQITSTHQF